MKIRTPEYNSWLHMRRRCNDIKDNRYKEYGAKGIKVCDRWNNSFENFLEDMGNKPDKTYTINRIDGKLGYYKENCKWSTKSEQSLNRSNNIIVTYKGETKLLFDFCKELNLPYKTIFNRYKQNWNINDVFEKPIKKGNNSALRDIKKPLLKLLILNKKL